MSMDPRYSSSAPWPPPRRRTRSSLLPALAVLSLLWMSVRLCRQASFGRKGSAVVRSLYATLLGIGGWCVGALVALSALPTVPVDDQALAVISVGFPVGLAVYCGWL